MSTRLKRLSKLRSNDSTEPGRSLRPRSPARILPYWRLIVLYPRAAGGDPVAFDGLLESTFGLIFDYARKLSRNSSEFDDMLEVGYMGFVRGVVNRRWNPRRGAWSTYIGYSIRGPMLRLRGMSMDRDVVRVPEGQRREGRQTRKSAATGRSLSTHCPCENPYSVRDYLGDVADSRTVTADVVAEQNDELNLMKDKMQLLFPRELYVLKRRIMNGETLKVVGRDMGLSRERVRQIEHRALNRLRGLCHQSTK